MKKISSILLISMISLLSTAQQKFTGKKGEIKLITLDPGHFHAALIQKKMYDEIDPQVFVYAPIGDEVNEHLARIESYNNRSESPTHWVETIYRGTDFLPKMLAEKKGNVMMVAGKNDKKIDYILAALDNGINVFADKPLIIKSEDYPKLEKAFRLATKKGVLLYDIMTERSEITTLLQRELSQNKSLFGELIAGTPELPAITKESVHHYYKNVSGKPLIRPAWFFDTDQQGQGIVDVTTHLVDLVQWEAFPEQIIKKENVSLIEAKKWNTPVTLAQFSTVTNLKEFPAFLQKNVINNVLEVPANGEIVYRINGKVAKVSVIWNYEAPAGTGDTHYSIMRGTKSAIEIRQGKEEGYKPTLYVIGENLNSTEIEKAVSILNQNYKGIGFEKIEANRYKIIIPEMYNIGHEAHFAQVTERYLSYLKDGKLPDWEVPNMLVKYFITMQAYNAVNEK